MKKEIAPVGEFSEERAAEIEILPGKADRPSGDSRTNVIHNTGTVIFMYDRHNSSPQTTDWWLVVECIMLAAYAFTATAWILLSR